MEIDSPGQSTELLLDVVRAIESQNIRYAVIGAMAVALHGVVRASVDSDAIVAATFAQLTKLRDELTTRGLKCDLRLGDPSDPIPGMLVVSDRFENRVDLLMGLRGLDPDVFKQTIEVTMPELGGPLSFVCKEDLLAMKLFAGGAKDLLDAERLVAVSGPRLDVELVEPAGSTFWR